MTSFANRPKESATTGLSATTQAQIDRIEQHPPRTQLWSFATGKLHGSEFDAVADHLLLCPNCSEIVDSLPIEQDTFVAGMQNLFDKTKMSQQHDEQWTTPSADRSPAPGSRFTILRPHASGGLGEVWLAHDRDFDRQVALKQLRAERVNDPTSRERFHLEAEITGKLEHPGIVPVYGLGRHASGEPFYAMRFIQGQTLSQAIREFHNGELNAKGSSARRLALRKLLQHFVNACQAVAYAHSRGVVHRDLKPSNIMLGPFGETLVVDWGLAKVLPQPGTNETAPEQDCAPARLSVTNAVTDTLHGKMVGTLPYSSPEQCQGRHDLMGPASDIYSLGATLYEILVGRPPFSEADRTEMARRISQGDFVRPRQLSRQLPAGLEAICLKAMAADSAKRYESVLRMAADIESWLADEPVTAWPEPLATRVSRRMRRRVTWVAATIVALLILLAVLPFGLRLQQRTQLNRSQLFAISAESANQRGEMQEVVNRLEQSLATGHPEPVRLQIQRVKALGALHQPARALAGVRELEQRADLGEYRSQVILWHGDLLVMQSHLNEGLKKIEQALELGLPPADESYAHAMLAPDSREAARYFEVALELDPYQRQALEQLALLLIWSGKRDEARLHLKVISQISPHLPYIPVFSAWLAALDGGRSLYEEAPARVQLGDSGSRKLERMCANFVRMRDSLSRWMTAEDDGTVEKAHAELLGDLLNPDVNPEVDSAASQRLFRIPPVLIRAYTPLFNMYSENPSGFDGRKYVAELERASVIHPEGSIQLMKAILLAGPIAQDALGRKSFEEARSIFADVESASVEAAEGPSLIAGMDRLAWYLATMAAKGQAQCLNSQGKDWTEEIQRAIQHGKRCTALGPMRLETEATYFYYIAKEANDEEFALQILLEQIALRPHTERANWQEKLTRSYLRMGDFTNAVRAADELLAERPDNQQVAETRKAALDGMKRYLDEHAADVK